MSLISSHLLVDQQLQLLELESSSIALFNQLVFYQEQQLSRLRFIDEILSKTLLNTNQHQRISIMEQFSQNIYTWVKDSKGNNVFQKKKIKTELANCKDGRLGLNPGGQDYLGLKTGYQCPKDINYQIKGTFSGQQSKFIQASVRDCNQTYLDEVYNKTKKCKSPKEIARVSSLLKLYFVVENSYFDETDYSNNAVKKFLKPYYLTSKNNTSMYYYMLISQNEINKQDNLFLENSELDTFLETRIDYSVQQELEAVDAYNNAYIAIYIQMDDQVKTVNRKLMTFLDALGNTGGFMSILFVIAFAMIQYFQKTIYYTSLIKSLFVYQTDVNQQDPNKEQNDKSNDQYQQYQKEQDQNSENSEQKTLEYYPESQRKMAENQSLFRKIFDQLRNREKLHYSITDAVEAQIKKFGCCCRKISREKALRDFLYNKGILKIHKELDLRYVIKELRTLRFISNILLNKHQRFLLPYFKANLLNHQPQKRFDDQDKLSNYLNKAIQRQDQAKIDKRILKYIELSDDDQVEVKIMPDKLENTNSPILQNNATKSIDNTDVQSQTQSQQKSIPNKSGLNKLKFIITNEQFLKKSSLKEFKSASLKYPLKQSLKQTIKVQPSGGNQGQVQEQQLQLGATTNNIQININSNNNTIKNIQQNHDIITHAQDHIKTLGLGTRNDFISDNTFINNTFLNDITANQYDDENEDILMDIQRVMDPDLDYIDEEERVISHYD
ncbi:UNKNOWN [Stylonychia lemnae]|uniref:Transmembrane protein n=1 Tax=Stylonychia lemnae TaxID=5949 RepID=A0A078B367_STYLE|nr:UNKNOWN [Stylonychia lemnae]|eukprot:CDW87692.1 UNKNOWN [Stylonychia lemnae]